jgi:hypothetical protein
VTERLNNYFDVTQFVSPPPFQFGNISRTLPDVSGPGWHVWDISILKTTRIGENVRFQLRGEAFNTLNRAVFANPGLTFGTASFGRINAVADRANPARQIMLGARLIW